MRGKTRGAWSRIIKRRKPGSLLIIKSSMPVSSITLSLAIHCEKSKSIFLKYKEIQNRAVAKSYMTRLTASSYRVKYLRISSYIRNPSSYMTLQLLHSEFYFIFCLCNISQCTTFEWWSVSRKRSPYF
jgi:hypothetical protein